MGKVIDILLILHTVYFSFAYIERIGEPGDEA